MAGTDTLRARRSIFAALAWCVALVTPAWGNDESVDFLRCFTGALKAIPISPDPNWHEKRAAFARRCMNAKGYEINWKRCPVGLMSDADDRALTSGCYDGKSR